jgi:hypothetical protein
MNWYEVVRNNTNENGQRSLQIEDGNGKVLCSINESAFEVVDGKAKKKLDRFWGLPDNEVIETLIQERVISPPEKKKPISLSQVAEDD